MTDEQEDEVYEPAPDEHGCIGIEDLLEVMKTHSRVLERHATAIGGIGKTLKSIEADLKVIRDAQLSQNQLTANLHSMYSRLQCMMPGDDPPCPTDDDFRRSSPSEEIRQLRLLGGDDVAGEE